MRSVQHLAVTPADQALTITCDERDPQAGNMSHVYRVQSVPGAVASPPGSAAVDVLAGLDAEIHFQHGPVLEAGVNGLTNEALLAIVRDRLEGAQEGPFRCRENALAITAIEEASLWLAKRTLDRMGRGVEGKSNA